MMISQTALMIPNVVADGLEFDHGETDEKPRPEPSASRISDRAAAATAPPMIEAQEIAETGDSTPSAGAPPAPEPLLRPSSDDTDMSDPQPSAPSHKLCAIYRLQAGPSDCARTREPL